MAGKGWGGVFNGRIPTDNLNSKTQKDNDARVELIGAETQASFGVIIASMASRPATGHGIHIPMNKK